jgi:SAM-dependent methyltransferase
MRPGGRYSDAVRNEYGHGGSPSIADPDYWWYVARADLLEATLRSFVDGARLVLDLGSADGPSAAWVRDAAACTVSLDIDPRGLGPDGVCGSALALPFAAGAFDVVCAFDVIEHCEPEETALAEVRRVLRPGGRLVLSVPAYSWAWSDFDVANGHHRRYTRARAEAAVEHAGFTVHRSTYAFASVFPLFAAERMARKVRRSAHGGPADIVPVPQLPKPLNDALLAMSRLDRRLLERRDLPFGSSVFVAATRA